MNKAFKILRVIGYWCNRKYQNDYNPDLSRIIEEKEKCVYYYTKEIKNNDSYIYLYWKGDNEEIIKVLSLVGIKSSCENPEYEKIKCFLN